MRGGFILPKNDRSGSDNDLSTQSEQMTALSLIMVLGNSQIK